VMQMHRHFLNCIANIFSTLDFNVLKVKSLLVI
jgi:hypothetical protein